MTAPVLRDYQTEDEAKIFAEWESVRSTLLCQATGLGKTVLMVSVALRMLPGRTMFLAHRTELIAQAQQAFQRAGMESEIEKAELSASTNLFGRAPVVLASVQTLLSGPEGFKRMKRFNPMDFSLLLYDECFVAGTMVGHVPIEKIRYGDEVDTHRGRGTVTHVFKKHATALVQVLFSDGRRITCTPEHPVWTPRGFVPASLLTPRDMVLTITPHEQMRHLRESGEKQTVSEPGVPVRNDATPDQANIRETRRGNHEIPQNKRDAQSGDAGACVREAASNGMEADRTRRKRARPDNSTASIGGGAGVGHGNRNQNWSRKRAMGERLAELLQGGRWKSCAQNSRGDRWKLTLCADSESARREERRLSAFVRVVGVEIIQRGSGSRFTELCPDGFVYNLEVSNGNTYTANGVLVHNCHHAVAEGNKSIVDYFREGNPNLKILLVTATPDRADEEALGQICETVANERDILWAVDNGWLVPVEQQFVTAGELDFSHVETTAGELNMGQLAAVMEAEAPVQSVVQASLESVCRLPLNSLNDVPVERWPERLALVPESERRRGIVFTVSVKQAEMLCNIFNRVVPGLAGWVCGKTPDRDRAEVLGRFKDSPMRLLVNVGVATEGYDNPNVDLIIGARPTKSRSLYAQMIGRATRALPGIVDGPHNAKARQAAIAASAKPSMLALDFVGNSGRHKLMTTADVLGGNISDEAVERAVKKAKEDGKTVDMRELLEKSEAELRAEAEARRLAEEGRKAKLVAKVRYVTRAVNPFDAFDLQPARARGWDAGKQLSEKQAAVLLKQGIDPAQMEYGQAKAVLNELFRRWSGKLATIRQCALLKKHGYDTKEMTMKEASAKIDALAKNRWQRPAMPVEV